MAPSNHREPLCPTPGAEFPWQMAVADYFAMGGDNYLVVADSLTGWIEVYKMDGKAMKLIKTLRNLFAQMGVPEELAIDGGPAPLPTRPGSGASITSYLHCRIVLFVFQMIGFPMCVFFVVFTCK